MSGREIEALRQNRRWRDWYFHYRIEHRLPDAEAMRAADEAVAEERRKERARAAAEAAQGRLFSDPDPDAGTLFSGLATKGGMP